MISFTIPYPRGGKQVSAFCRRHSLNAYYSGKHWAERKADADALHTLARVSMLKAKIPRELVTGPVEISFFWDDGLDIDNHAALGKAFVDAMKGWVLPEDNRHWFRRVVHDFWDGGAILVEIVPYKEKLPERMENNEPQQNQVPAQA